MPLDPSIIQSGQGATDFSGAIGAGVNMAALLQQKKMQGLEMQQKQRAFNDETATRNAMGNNTTVNPDGTVTVNRMGVMSDLNKMGASHLIPQVQQNWAQMDSAQQKMKFDRLKQQYEMGGQILGPLMSMDEKSPEFQKAYDSAMKQLHELGLPMNDFPQQADMTAVKNHFMQAVDGSKQLDAMFKKTDQGQKAQEISETARHNQATEANARQEAGNKAKELAIQGQRMTMDLRKEHAQQNQETLSALQALRGNPALQRAETNVLAAKNLNDLADQTIDPKTGKRNLNNMNPQAIDLFNHELVRMATGGSGNESDMEHLSPGTPGYKFAQIRQKIMGAKTPAQAAAFVQQGIDYANSLSKSSNQFLYQNAKHVVDAKRNYLGSDDQKTYDKWLDDMKSGKAFFGDMSDGGAVQKASVTPHPQDNQAIAWAKSNPNDPRAAKILQVNGINMTAGQ